MLYLQQLTFHVPIGLVLCAVSLFKINLLTLLFSNHDIISLQLLYRLPAALLSKVQVDVDLVLAFTGGGRNFVADKDTNGWQ